MKKALFLILALCILTLSSYAQNYLDVEKRNAEEDVSSIYKEVKTENDYGVILKPTHKKGDFDSELVDNPSVFTYNGKWYMTYVGFNGEGYSTGLAVSDNLTDWKRLGVILENSGREKAPKGAFDSYNTAGYIATVHEWGKPPVVLKVNGKFVMTYLGTSEPGYEKGKICAGIAYADKLEGPWTKEQKPIVEPNQTYEHDKIWKSNLILDNGTYYLFYNTSVSPEVMSVATSKDLKTFTKYDKNPILKTEYNTYDYSYSFNSDPQVVKINGKWVMFNFTDTDTGIVDTFALSDDLFNWKKSYMTLTSTKQPYNSSCAHKPWVFKNKDVVYHFYCAVGSDKERTIALASSVNKEKLIELNKASSVFNIVNLVLLIAIAAISATVFFMLRKRLQKV